MYEKYLLYICLVTMPSLSMARFLTIFSISKSIDEVVIFQSGHMFFQLKTGNKYSLSSLIVLISFDFLELLTALAIINKMQRATETLAYITCRCFALI